MPVQSAEQTRLEEDRRGTAWWRRWGPYVAERAWGTVREDYSTDGNAWTYFPHDQARSKAFRWGEDGLAAICDRYQLLVSSLALWNGRDPFLKERLFGVVPQEANHGEDVKEYYYYLDATPTYSYAKFLYKYPQAAFPYDDLISVNRSRTIEQPEYELLDTGIFDGDRYFDVFVEYAKAGPEDICIRIEAINRGSAPAELHLIPQLWFRNRWSWGKNPLPPPTIHLGLPAKNAMEIVADDATGPPLVGLLKPYRLGPRYVYGELNGQPLFTENETHMERVYGPGSRSAGPYVKDAFHRQIVDNQTCTNPDRVGTKAGLHYRKTIPAGGSWVLRLRLSEIRCDAPLADVDDVVAMRKKEADQFYDSIYPPAASADERMVQRQAFAGLLWSKQVYLFDVRKWLDGDNPDWPPPANRGDIRNGHWRHLNSQRIFSIPDKWEYPWFAAWDLAFQCIPLTLIEPDFAKEQLWLLLFEQFQHPNGQVPAYEWEFSDLNPPVHAWAVWRVYRMDMFRSGKADRPFLEKCFHKLLLNFTWWVNRVDAEGLNVFEGGFLGLDNVTVFDRSKKLADGLTLRQSDGTGWMGMFCLTMMRIALELAKENRAYSSLATKFLEHYMVIGSAIKHMGRADHGLWHEDDGFFYDVLSGNGKIIPFRVRSLVGLIPVFALQCIDDWELDHVADFRDNLHWYIRNRAEFAQRCVTILEQPDGRRYVLALLDPQQLVRVLQRVWSQDEFRGPFGLRSLSKYHEQHPFEYGGRTVNYEPGEAQTMLKGGNSNWRGPVWFPTTFLMIETLRRYASVYGSDFVILEDEGKRIGFPEMAGWFSDRLIALFTRDQQGRRPAFGNSERFQCDPHWRDLVLFYEYFHGDTGAGLGASHQTGWTALVATLIDEWRRPDWKKLRRGAERPSAKAKR